MEWDLYVCNQKQLFASEVQENGGEGFRVLLNIQRHLFPAAIFAPQIVVKHKYTGHDSNKLRKQCLP